MLCEWSHKIFKVNEAGFEELALEIFRFQYSENELYKKYVDALKINSNHIDSLQKIPFLPIRFFKSHKVQTTRFQPQIVFESSGTTKTQNSQHLVKDLDLYKESFICAFEMFYGPVKNYCIIALLPSYLERKTSSLVFMVNELIRQSGHPKSGFYLNEYDKLNDRIQELENEAQKTLLIGVTFALLAFAEKFQIHFSNSIIMETGGMKGRREEMIREEVHAVLKNAFHVNAVHSEYGMTELLSQAYSTANGVFKCPPWMKLMLRDEEDPLSFRESKRSPGAINIIDLANVFSCCFIATDDVGKIYPDGNFEVLGRMDGSDLRGCSLMAV